MDQRQNKTWLKHSPSDSQAPKHFCHFIFVLSFPIPLLLSLHSMCRISLPIQHLGVSEMSLKVYWIPPRISSLIDISVKIFHLVPVSIQVLKKTSSSTGQSVLKAKGSPITCQQRKNFNRTHRNLETTLFCLYPFFPLSFFFFIERQVFPSGEPKQQAISIHLSSSAIQTNSPDAHTLFYFSAKSPPSFEAVHRVMWKISSSAITLNFGTPLP